MLHAVAIIALWLLLMIGCSLAHGASGELIIDRYRWTGGKLGTTRWARPLSHAPEQSLPPHSGRTDLRDPTPPALPPAIPAR